MAHTDCIASAAIQLSEHCADATSSIYIECAAILAGNTPTAISSLSGCGTALVELLSRQASIVHAVCEKLQSAEKYEAPYPNTNTVSLKRLDDIASIAYDKFYAFLFSELPICWRMLYTDARILKFCLILIQSPYFNKTHLDHNGRSKIATRDDSHVDELVKSLDQALILAGAAGERRGRIWIDKALELLRQVASYGPDDSSQTADIYGRPAKRIKVPLHEKHISTYEGRDIFSAHEPFTPSVKCPIRCVDAISLEEFQAHLDQSSKAEGGPQPLIIRGSLTDWPALGAHPWRSPSYLLWQTFDGRRLVPVEIGRSYVDEGWGQKIITFGEFLCEYIDSSLSSNGSILSTSDLTDNPEMVSSTHPASDTVKPIAYLAQHPLLTQLPALRNDILIPDFCYTTPPSHPTDSSIDQPELEEPLLNAWFGPPRTITPLHNDPYHNILAQVVGRKYVRLYSPLETPRIRPRGKENGVEMGNTSLFDVGAVEGWDRANEVTDGDNIEGEQSRGENMQDDEMIASFREIPFLDCILEPGDVLYIPIGWWHYVRSLSVSFSVSFWWN
ncbi:hypothetical protein F5Y15DRAFT_153021 [Xylariaceae sp. FL0016]|nr:hypothetical protein F5Y15DRAFT_153021 [Xylariaceae sp. FL0016]